MRGRSQTVDLLEQKGVMTDLQEREDTSKVNLNHVGTRYDQQILTIASRRTTLMNQILFIAFVAA